MFGVCRPWGACIFPGLANLSEQHFDAAEDAAVAAPGTLLVNAQMGGCLVSISAVRGCELGERRGESNRAKPPPTRRMSFRVLGLLCITGCCAFAQVAVPKPSSSLPKPVLATALRPPGASPLPATLPAGSMPRASPPKMTASLGALSLLPPLATLVASIALRQTMLAMLFRYLEHVSSIDMHTYAVCAKKGGSAA